jgi:hypothetical protein
VRLSISRRGFLAALAGPAFVYVESFDLLATGAAGEFRGKIATEWMPDGRNMRLLEPLEYLAPDGRIWPVPKGAVVDGASIPPVFWSVIGGPFEGLYRGPSVVHDYYCETRIRKHTDVHRVFYDAMLTAGVGPKKAWLMFKAVERFGPQWSDPKIDPECEVVDENFDFEKCARNSAPPTRGLPSTSKDDLLEFAKDMEGEADAGDIAKLRKAIESD